MRCDIFLKSLKHRPIAKGILIAITIATTVGIGIAAANTTLSSNTVAIISGILGTVSGIFGGAIWQLGDNDYILELMRDMKKEKIKYAGIQEQKYYGLICGMYKKINDITVIINKNRNVMSKKKEQTLKKVSLNVSRLFGEYYIISKRDVNDLEFILLPKINMLNASIERLDRCVKKAVKIREDVILAVDKSKDIYERADSNVCKDSSSEVSRNVPGSSVSSSESGKDRIIASATMGNGEGILLQSIVIM